MSKNGGFKTLLTGILIGVGIGYLTSPHTGEENRKIVKDKAKDTIDKIKNINLEEVKDKLVSDYNKLCETLKDMDKEKAKELALREGKKLLEKCEDLIVVAKEKSAPVIEKTAKDVKKNLGNLLKNWGEKLSD